MNQAQVIEETWLDGEDNWDAADDGFVELGVDELLPKPAPLSSKAESSVPSKVEDSLPGSLCAEIPKKGSKVSTS